MANDRQFFGWHAACPSRRSFLAHGLRPIRDVFDPVRDFTRIGRLRFGRILCAGTVLTLVFWDRGLQRPVG